MSDTSGVPGDAVALRVQVAGLRAANESLRALLEDKDAKIAGLEAQVAAQAERIARLERLISRNSGNSSMPPSGDDQPGKTPPAPKPRRGAGKRKPGKQPGAPGAYLAWNDHPDRAEDLVPAGPCECGTDLNGAADLGVVFSHQVNDLPEEVRAQTVQYDRHEVECACGRVHVAAAPPQAGGAAPGTVAYGVNFQAWCVFLMVMHRVPVERCADIIESMSGTRPSSGWVHALLARSARAVAAANKAIRALILLARVICGDETPLRAGPGPKANKKYLQAACTSLFTYYFLGERSLPSFKGFIYSDLHGAVVVHDRYVNYDHFADISHQLCTAHLLRDIEDAAQTYPDAIWPGQIARELRALIHAANVARDQGLTAVPDELTAGHLKLFRNGVNAGLPRSAASPAAATSSSRPPCTCGNASSTAKPTCCGSSPTPPSRPPATWQNATCAPLKPSRRSAAGSAPRPRPGTATPSAVTHPPPASTELTCSPRSRMLSPEIPGYHPSRPSPELHQEPSTHSYPYVTTST